MLEAFKSLGTNKEKMSAGAELQALIISAREERAALSEMLTQVSLRSQKLGPLGKSLEQVETKATGASERLEELAQRLATLEERARTVEEIDGRVTELHQTVGQAQQNVDSIETRLSSLAALQELSRSTEENLAALNALAEHVSLKVKALEGQKQAVERAVVEANRLNEMVWAMDVQIQKLNEGSKQVAETEEMLGRLETLAHEASQQLDAAAEAKEKFGQQIGRLQQESTGLAEAIGAHVERLTVEKKEFEVIDQRLLGLQTAVSEAEGRMQTLVTKEKTMAQLGQRADALARQLQDLTAQSDELTKKQTALESLNERLAQVDELTKRTSSQLASLKGQRQDLDVVRGEIQEFHRSYGEATRLRDKLATDRTAFEAFSERMTQLQTRAPELESKMDAILAKFSLIEEGNQKATRLGELTAELEGLLTRVTSGLQFVERVEARMNTLGGLSADVDRTLTDQLARRAELESLRTQCDGISVLVMDAQRKLEAVNDNQTKLLPIAGQVAALHGEIATASSQIHALQRDDTMLADQERRLNELVNSGRALAVEVTDRVRQVQSLCDELTNSASLKDELVSELAGVRAHQRDVVATIESSDEQAKRIDACMSQLEQRWQQLTSAERKIVTFETRIGELEQLTHDVNVQIDSIASRQALVAAVKAEVDTVHELGARSKSDLQYVGEHRAEIATLKHMAEELLALMSQTENKLELIESRKKLVDEVEAKSSMIVNVLDDVRVNLEAVGEQKALVDHVAEKLVRADFVLQEAQNTLRALHQERELAERIEQNVKHLRERTPRKAQVSRLKVQG